MPVDLISQCSLRRGEVRRSRPQSVQNCVWKCDISAVRSSKQQCKGRQRERRLLPVCVCACASVCESKGIVCLVSFKGL